MSKNIAIVYGTFHQKPVTEMLNAIRKAAPEKNLKIVKEIAVPGSMEKPLAVKRLLLDSKIDGVVVMGIIEKGETKHGRVMADAVISALIGLELELMKPLGVAILGPDIELHQIDSRAVPYALNALDALEIMLAN